MRQKNHCQGVDRKESLWYRTPQTRRAWGESTVSASEINVQVSQGILWVGSEAYPLRNIARVQPVKLAPNRGAAFRGFMIAVVFCVLLIVAAAVATRAASRVTSVQGYNALHYVADGAFALAGVLAVISVIRLIMRLLRRTVYALVIETAGTPRTALVTYDENLVLHLVRRITAAINNPHEKWGERIPVINNYNVNAAGAKGVLVGQGNVFKGNIS
jgi:Family of unknown function (DUF6232)